MEYHIIAKLLIGAYYILFSAIAKTKNIPSAIVFNVIPLLSGIYLLVTVVIQMRVHP